MTGFSNARAWSLSGCCAIGLIAFCGSARAEVLFDSLDGPNAAAFSAPGLDATFSTGASSFRATDIALLLSGGAPSSGSLPGDCGWHAAVAIKD